MTMTLVKLVVIGIHLSTNGKPYPYLIVVSIRYLKSIDQGGAKSKE
jgi:hypothetical protein